MMTAAGDQTEAIAGRVRDAAAAGTPLAIRGGRSKDFYGHPTIGEPLELGAHTGIVNYEPTELILTARAGTPLAEIEAVLADNGQTLAFEPPHFGGGATLGGTVAAGLSGPRRPFGGAVRDHVLGVRLIDGRGAIQRFGGEVMKNVAGYDLARLSAGALGTLGVLLDVSLKVLPRPDVERTVRVEVEPGHLQERVEVALRAGAPVTAAAHDGTAARVRLGGARSAVDAGARTLGGDADDDADFWVRLRDHRLPFFEPRERPLWRVALPPGTVLPGMPGERFVDWNAQLIWLRTPTGATHVRAAAGDVGGHATLFRGTAGPTPVFTPLPAPLWRLHQRLKSALDPQGILNPGRMYPEL